MQAQATRGETDDMTRQAARLRTARAIVDAAARYDLIRGGKWGDLNDGQREDWLQVVREVLEWGA